jgi:hypothetical protein
MDRLIAGGSVAVATGTLAILFSMLSGPAASWLTWIFAIIAAVAFAAVPWTWYLRCRTWMRSRVPARDRLGPP